MLKKLKEFFIPSAQNGYKPNSLERMSVGIMLVLVLLSFAAANIQSLLWISSNWMVSTILPAVIVDLTNSERGHENLGTLKRNALLDKAAQLKANDMAKYSYFAHYSPTGVSPWYWFDQVSYNYVHAGENLAVHFTDSGDVVKAWMNSPSHKENILNGKYTEIGVGTATGTYKGYPTVFVVQLFGTPNAIPKQVAQEVAGIEAPVKTISVESVSIATGSKATSSDEVVANATLDTAEVAKVEVPPQIPSTATPIEDETETVVMYSDLATSSRGGIPATIDTNQMGGEQNTEAPNILLRSATQPKLWLQIVYACLSFVVLIALVFSIFIEWRRQNPLQIAYAGGLLAVMIFLLYVHVTLTSSVSII